MGYGYMSLTQLLKKCRESTQQDFEGSDTYRLHYRTAQRLIREAYKLGVLKAKEKGNE